MITFRSPAYLGNLIKDYYIAQPKTNPVPVSLNNKVYVLIQFIALTGGLVKYIMEFDDLSTFYKIACLGLIILTIQSCGYILENKTKRFPLEIIRLIGAGILLNALYYTQYNNWFTFMLVLSIVVGVFSSVWFIYENYIKRKATIKVSNP
jgi:O-antigen/teichoic acid export membrane protein